MFSERYVKIPVLVLEDGRKFLPHELKFEKDEHYGNSYVYGQFRIVRWRGGSKTVLTTSPSIKITHPSYTAPALTYVIPFNEVVLNDEYIIEAWCTEGNTYLENLTRFTVNQTPVPNNSIPVSNLWVSSSTSTSQIQSEVLLSIVLFCFSVSLNNF